MPRQELLTVIVLAAVVGVAASVAPTGALLAWFALIIAANVLHRRRRGMARCCSLGALGAVVVAIAPVVAIGAGVLCLAVGERVRQRV